MLLEVYPNAIAAGTALWEAQEAGADSDYESDEAKAEWLQLCAHAGSDPAAAERVAEAFAEAHSV